MAHNINTYIGRQAAWHKLGTVTGKFMTWDEIQAHGGLNFVPQKEQLFDRLGNRIEYTDHLRSTRKDDLGESAMFGAGDRLKTQALEVILESASALPALRTSQPIYSRMSAPVQPNVPLLDQIMAGVN